MKLPPGMFFADFVGVTHAAQRAVYTFKFEVDEEDAETCLSMLGGLPKSGEGRPVLIWRPDPKKNRAAAEALQSLTPLPAPEPKNESEPE